LSYPIVLPGKIVPNAIEIDGAAGVACRL